MIQRLRIYTASLKYAKSSIFDFRPLNSSFRCFKLSTFAVFANGHDAIIRERAPSSLRLTDLTPSLRYVAPPFVVAPTRNTMYPFAIDCVSKCRGILNRTPVIVVSSHWRNDACTDVGFAGKGGGGGGGGGGACLLTLTRVSYVF